MHVNQFKVAQREIQQKIFPILERKFCCAHLIVDDETCYRNGVEIPCQIGLCWKPVFSLLLTANHNQISDHGKECIHRSLNHPIDGAFAIAANSLSKKKSGTLLAEHIFDEQKRKSLC